MKTYTKKEFNASESIRNVGETFEDAFSRLFGFWGNRDRNCGCVLIVGSFPIPEDSLFRAYEHCPNCLGKGTPPIHWKELK